MNANILLRTLGTQVSLLPQVTDGLGVWSAFWTPSLLMSMVLCLTLCPSCVLPQGMNISPMPDNENREEGTIEGGWMLLEQRVEHLVPAFLGRDPSYLFTFLSTYRAFATTQ